MRGHICLEFLLTVTWGDALLIQILRQADISGPFENAGQTGLENWWRDRQGLTLRSRGKQSGRLKLNSTEQRQWNKSYEQQHCPSSPGLLLAPTCSQREG